MNGNDTDYKRAFSLLPLQISSIKRGPEHEVIAKQGGKAAEAARKQLESDLGHSVISPLNARTGLRLKDKNDKE